MNEWINRRGAYTSKGTLFGLEKECSADTCRSTGALKTRCQGKRANTKRRSVWSRWCSVPGMSDSQRQEVEWWLPGDMGQGAKGSCYLMSAVWGDNKALEVGGIMVAQQCECILLKMDKVINFMLHVFYHNKKYLVFLHRNSLWTLAHENRISSKECLNRAQNEMFGCTVISFLFTSKWFGKLTEDSGIFGGE